MVTMKESNVAELYEDASVFITGGSGFVGKLLINKLLLSCPRIKMIYLLLRQKKGLDPQQRSNQVFNDIIFNNLKAEMPNFRDKVTVVTGDCSLPDLGISEVQRSILINEVNVVIHGAATVRFNENFKTAININVAAVKSMIRLAHQMQKLKAYIHISTAFCNCTQTTIEEKIYDFPHDYDELIELSKTKDDKYWESMTDKYLGNMPNTYVFTKAAAEQIIFKEGQHLPVAIVRPSIILSTSKDPIAGWTDNVYGPTGLVLASTLGCIKVIPCDKDCVSDVVPADLVVNAIIASSWKTYYSYQEGKSRIIGPYEEDNNNDIVNNNDSVNNTKSLSSPPIYNFVSGNRNPITWCKYASYLQTLIHKNGSEKSMLYPTDVMLCSSFFLYKLLFLIFHFIPAFFIDLYLKYTGSKIRLWNEYQKLEQLSGALFYFSIRQWTIDDTNIRTFWESLSPADKLIYPFDIKQLDWNDYLDTYFFGIKKYLIKESMDPKRAKQRIRRLYRYHVLLKTVIYTAAIFFTSCVIRLAF